MNRVREVLGPAPWARSQLALRTLVVLGPLVAVLAAAPAGAEVGPAVLGGLLLVGLLAARSPGSPVPTVTTLGAVLFWVRVPADALHASLLVAVAALVTTHVAATLAAAGPVSAPVHRVLVRRWAVRGALLVAPAVPVWLLARVLVGREPVVGAAWPLGLAAVVLLAVVGTVAVREDRP